MSTTAVSMAATPTRRSLLRIYWLEGKFELFKLVRMPAYIVPTIAFPVMFYILFGLSLPTGDFDMASYLIATYGAFGVIGVALFGFGVGVAVERGQGWMLLKRATPMPPLAYFTAKMAVSLVFSFVIVLLLGLLGVFFGGVRLELATWLILGCTLLAGSLPFCAFGLALGYLSGPNGAPGLVNLIYLPSAFASGLWIPIQVLPSFFQKVAVVLPPYHLGQLALKSLDADAGQPVALHVMALTLFGIGSLLIALIAYRRDAGKTYG
ncbi:MAG: ABC transporter permease [Thermoanaerobaculia bacterium]|nr:ABC transporter permease [Thermoanaerobaculia bacterium]